MGKQMTNIEAIVNLMEFSRYGVMAQLFVIDALEKHSKKVAEAPIEAFDGMKGGFISPEAWQGVAREIQEKLDKHLAPRPSRKDPGDITKEEFMAMQKEIEGIELSIAKGQEDDQADQRLSELRELMEESPWALDHDEGVIEKSALGHQL